MDITDINRIITDADLTPEHRARIMNGGYVRDGFYYNIKCFSLTAPEGEFHAGLGSAEHAIDNLFLARFFHPENRYEVTEISELVTA